MSKIIAIMDKPNDCQQCIFGICKYSLPLSVYSKGYYCQLLPPEKRVVQEFDYDAEVHLDNCPLVPLPEKRPCAGAEGIKSNLLTERVDEGIREAGAFGWNACIDAITGEREEK